ncbi:DUF4157 domain-containing protein [Nodularia sp. UHCC 0506]|uniref:eCIS core domain-containing protein n=1 Tax=Nodularia sp. UHCC 0506 TaxID=3110243 RepID=UPI002B2112F6|nr:DUF4157 domain-containing protein [Nodularia sp. UHCC 0506]MEA5516990.1 DUF4157 domain-containing protein [Nodularia sp. UHCC 0506]
MKPEITSLQRQEEPEEELQAKSILQRREAIGGGEASTDLDTAINSARGSGQQMADNIRQPMEQAFGADFSGVKVHTDGQSDQLNQSIQARAFTTGQDVFFRQGEYNPGSRGGQELLAHELTHVVQQNEGAVQRSLQRKNAQSISIDYSLQEPLVQCQPYYRGGNSLAPKMNEVKIDSRTKKLKNTHGVSLFDLKKGLGKFGGTYEVKSIPDTLKIIQRGKNPNHFEIVPAENGKLDFEEFKNELGKVVLEKVEDE